MRNGKTSDPKYLKHLEKKNINEKWEVGRSRILKEHDARIEGLKDPRYSEFRGMLEVATNLEIIKSWDDSNKEVIADYCRRYEGVEIWKKEKEQNYWVFM